jgi:transcriptional regulator with XRE-family HTH domain
MTFGEQVRRWRIEKRFNQRDFADKVGIDFTYLSKIENNKMPPPSERAILLMAEVLEQDADILLQLAQKVPQDLKQVITGSREAPALLRAIQGLDENKIKRLTEIAEQMKEEPEK